ncbi:MAG TPA: hypothetical protein VF157_15665 [Chloroflexota bacterium]
MDIGRISVVLNGAANDKQAFQSAVRMAAREGAKVRVVLGQGCTHEMYERHLDFVLWDVTQRLRLQAPEITLETSLHAVDLDIRTAVRS